MPYLCKLFPELAMELNKEIFTIDAPAVAARLCEFIRERQAALQRDRLLVLY